MNDIYISEQFDIDETINRINELVVFYCNVYSLNEEESIMLRQPITKAILVALNEYMKNELTENFVFYTGPYVKMAVAEFRTHN